MTAPELLDSVLCDGDGDTHYTTDPEDACPHGWVLCPECRETAELKCRACIREQSDEAGAA